MSREGLNNLWQIGRSNKSEDRTKESIKLRKQIGKFGIGKLATFTITHNLTYITKSHDKILSVTVDFRQFSESSTGAGKEIFLPVHIIDNWDNFANKVGLSEWLVKADVDATLLNEASCTIVLLEELKDKARRIKPGELKWVLSTAMPLKTDFQVFLNHEEVLSSKVDYDLAFRFSLVEVPKQRLDNLQKSTGETWEVTENKLVSKSFPLGISGYVIVTERSLMGKSDDLARSHGFFIKVRERLINEEDALFGLKPLTHGTFNRFRAEIQAEDLDMEIKVSRETIEESEIKSKFQRLLSEVFLEANARWEKHEKDKENPKREGERSTVSPYLVEYPVAEAFLSQSSTNEGAEANEEWFYLNSVDKSVVNDLMQSLYDTPRTKYRYEVTSTGSVGRLVKFDLPTFTFWINSDHDLAKEYLEERTRSLLQDIVTAEAMLEVYLRESQVHPHIIGEVLAKRDQLLRGLAKDHASSPTAISKALLDASTDKYELEIQIVVATRALGFNSTHIAGPGEPDGIARFIDYPDTEKKVTLEAKSSQDIPSLSQLDFAGLREHMIAREADGCLLVAPSYPGSSQEYSAAANRAHEQKISCWTVKQLARFVSLAEKRHINAHHVLDIVLNYFRPEDVSSAIDRLLREPTWTNLDLYQAVVKALRSLDGRLTDRPRTLDMISTEISNDTIFADIQSNQVDETLRNMAGASQGGMTFQNGTVRIFVALDELERRLQSLVKTSGEPRRISQFRAE